MLPRIPDGIAPIVGYRLWVYTLDYGTAELHSLNHALNSVSWDPPLETCEWELAGSSWLVASCPRSIGSPGHIAPDEGCKCGFYAAREPLLLTELIRHILLRSERRLAAFGIVLGRVELAGKVIEHEDGYRAERVRITELNPIRGTEQSVMQLAGRLGLGLGHPIAPFGMELIVPPRPRPPDPSGPGPSSPRRRVKEWLNLAVA
jgi:hypothetical protein